jgi:putative transposase
MEYNKSSHGIYYARYHIVWIPKYRKKILIDGVREYLEIKLLEIRKWYPDVVYHEKNIQPDHIHLLLEIPPKYSVSQIVKTLKTNTARHLRNKFPFIKESYKHTSSIWSVGYFVSTIGVNEQIIKKYIQLQGKEDSGQAKLELE